MPGLLRDGGRRCGAPTCRAACECQQCHATMKVGEKKSEERSAYHEAHERADSEAEAKKRETARKRQQERQEDGRSSLSPPYSVRVLVGFAPLQADGIFVVCSDVLDFAKVDAMLQDSQLVRRLSLPALHENWH